VVWEDGEVLTLTSYPIHRPPAVNRRICGPWSVVRGQWSMVNGQMFLADAVDSVFTGARTFLSAAMPE
jgi:hypothetical protein